MVSKHYFSTYTLWRIRNKIKNMRVKRFIVNKSIVKYDKKKFFIWNRSLKIRKRFPFAGIAIIVLEQFKFYKINKQLINNGYLFFNILGKNTSDLKVFTWFLCLLVYTQRVDRGFSVLSTAGKLTKILQNFIEKYCQLCWTVVQKYILVKEKL